MSSTKADVPMGRAETKFREAFERLKAGKTHIVPKGTRMSQNAVAKEAGVLPSALRPHRFSKLCLDIAEWIEQHKDDAGQKSGRQKNLAERNARRTVQERLEAMRIQRDLALSNLVSAEAHILELTLENRRLRAFAPAPATPIRPGDRGKAAATKKPLRVVD